MGKPRKATGPSPRECLFYVRISPSLIGRIRRDCSLRRRYLTSDRSYYVDPYQSNLITFPRIESLPQDAADSADNAADTHPVPDEICTKRRQG